MPCTLLDSIPFIADDECEKLCIKGTLFTYFGGHKMVHFGLMILGFFIFPGAAADAVYRAVPLTDNLVLIDSGILTISQIGIVLL